MSVTRLGKVALTSGLVAKESMNSDKMLRQGSIYDRLEKAREQRLKTLAPQRPANDGPVPSSAVEAMRPKSEILPRIKPQEEFEPPTKPGLSRATKLGLGILAFSIMAGFTLLGWGTDAPQTNATAPAVTLPKAEGTPARVATMPKVKSAESDGLPVVPDAPSGPIVVEVQQDMQILNAPASSTANGVAQP